jgi:hypothetical protein
MLRPGVFAEGCELAAAGKVEVSLPDDVPEALTILLVILHSLGKNIKTRLKLLTVINVARLIDKYQLHNAVLPFSSIWVQNLKDVRGGPSLDNTGIKLWISICWVFGFRTEFRNNTRQAIMRSYTPKLDDTLPTPADVEGMYILSH